VNPSDKPSSGSSGKLPAKQQLRRELRQRVRAAGELNPDSVIEEISGFLKKNSSIRTVALYSALPGEVDLKRLVSHPELKDSVKWVFPKVTGYDLKFFQVRDPDTEMQAGAFAIMEPMDGGEELGIERVDLFLCPGLGFDRKGGRVGRGRGFYDRVLSRARADALKFGICFPFQLVDEVVMEGHDIRMDRIITG
jgi:5-formyltetrahydrofolate cyclo-ligase